MVTLSSNAPPSRSELGLSYALAVLKAEKNRYAGSLVYDDLASIIVGLAATRFNGNMGKDDPLEVFIDYGILLSEITSGIMLVLFVQAMPTRFWKVFFWSIVGVLLWVAFMVSPMCIILIGSFVVLMVEMMRRRSIQPPFILTLARLLPGSDEQERRRSLDESVTVSYTHLTLPTILLV